MNNGKHYNTIVRPHLEYSSSVWDPHTREKIHAIEMVQRRAACYVKRNYRNTSSVGDMQHMLNDLRLNWQTLEIRRKNQRLTMMYKIHNNLVGIDNFLEEKRRILPSHTHCYQYQVPVCTKDYHYYSFFPRATREWNKLSDAVHATTVEGFKSKLSAATDN